MFSRHSITRITLSVAALALPATLLVLTACGGGGGGGIAAASGPTQMGGSRQGAPLALASASATAQVSTFAGLFVGADGTGALANFNAPRAVVGDASGNLYVADTLSHTIRKVVIATGATTTLAGQVGVPGAAEGTGTAAQFSFPAGLATDGQALYVADTSNHKIRKIAPLSGTLANMTSANAVVTSLTGLTGASGVAGATDGAAAGVQFSAPGRLATDGTNLYVADAGNQKIRKVVIATGYTTSVTGAANLSSVAGAADGAGATATFSSPVGIATDGTNLYVADVNNNKIRVIAPAGGATLATINSASAAVSSLTGQPNTAGAAGAQDGGANAASFTLPVGIATDGANLYVADAGNNKIRKIAPTGGATLATINSASAVVSSFTGTALAASPRGFADGAATSALFAFPFGIFADGTNVYVADTGNGSVRQIAIATGQVSTPAGAGAAADGVGPAVRMDRARYSTTDGINLYLTDCGTHALVRKIEIATGRVTTLAGQPGLYTAVDGLGTVATFGCPYGITTDGASLYVVDGSNAKIRRLSPTGGATLATMTAATTMVTSLTGAPGGASTPGAADGAATTATFSAPRGITTDGVNLYVTEWANNKIRMISPTNGATLATMTAASAMVSSLTGAANTLAAAGAADGAAGSATLSAPLDVTTDGVRLYVADYFNNKIRVISPTGGATLATISAASAVVSSLTGAANTATAAGAADGGAPAASFNHPGGITTDGSNLYVMDLFNQKVRMIAPAAGATLATMTSASALVSSLTGAANTAAPTGYADGALASARFNAPWGINTDGVSLYIMDGGNGTVRRMH